MSNRYESILLDLLQRASGEFTQINADLAATSQGLKAQSAMADDINGQVREVAHREFSAFTPEEGRA